MLAKLISEAISQPLPVNWNDKQHFHPHHPWHQHHITIVIIIIIVNLRHKLQHAFYLPSNRNKRSDVEGHRTKCVQD